MMLHVAHAVQHGHHQILVHSVDTDVVVLAVIVSATLPGDNEIWVAFGIGKIFLHLAAYQIAASLGTEKSLALHTYVPCINWLRYCVRIYGTWQENCLDNMEFIPRSYCCTAGAGTSTS